MNPWEWLLTLFGWALFALAALGALIILFAVVVGVVRSVRSALGYGKATPPKLETYSAEAKVVAQDRFKDEIIMSAELVQAFQAGARWGWGFFHRK